MVTVVRNITAQRAADVTDDELRLVSSAIWDNDTNRFGTADLTLAPHGDK